MKKYFVRASRQMTGLVLSAILVSISEVLLALSMKRALEMLINRERSGLSEFALLFLGVIMLSGLGYFLSGVAAASFKRKYLTELKRDYAETMLNMSMDHFANYAKGSISSGISNDINKLETQYLDTIIKLIRQGTSFLLAGAVLFYFNPLLAVCICLFTLLLFFAPQKTHKNMYLLGQEFSTSMAEYSIKIQEILNGFLLIKVSNLTEMFKLELNHLNQKSEEVRYKLGIKESVLTSVLAIFSLMAFYVPFIIGAIFVYFGKVGIGALIAVINLSGSIINPVQQIGINLANLKAGRGILETMLNFINEESAPVSQHEITENHEHEELHEELKEAPDFHESLSLERVQFGYRERIILSNFSANIKKGSKTLILGASGSGKTTLLNLIAGLYTNYQGSILIDGREIRDLSRSFLSSCMAIVPQESFIFNRSLKENIVLSESLDTTRFEKVCREARLDDLIQKLPEGNNTILGEGAQNLSGGEKQRIGIARAFYQNAPIILADEPTSSLDEENASMIFDILLKSDATVICVTHKISETQRRKFDSVLMLQ